MAKRNFNNEYDPGWSNPICPGRFGFEIVPDDAPDAENDDGLISGQMVQTVLAIFLLVILAYAGLEIYEKAVSSSWTFFEKKIEETEPGLSVVAPIIDEALLSPEAETNVPELKPQKRLFNPDGTMKASFPLPPDAPPEDYYIPGQEPPAPEKYRETAKPSNFDPNVEAFNPPEASSVRQRSGNNTGNYRNKKAKTIGAYEIFDPETATISSEWEFFDDPR